MSRTPQSGRKIFSAGLLWIAPLLFLGIFFFYPLLAVFDWSFKQPAVSSATPTWAYISRPFFFTFGQALLSMLLTLVVGLPAAYLFARFSFRGKALLSNLCTIPFILPTVVVAAGFNALLGPHGWLNLGLMVLFRLDTPPVNLLNTIWIILLAHIFYNTAIVIRLVGNSLAHQDPRLSMAARVLGASKVRTFWEIAAPLARPSILAAALLVFIFDFTSFGVILLLGGPFFTTLEVEIYIQALQMLNLPLAAVLSLIQLLCTLGMGVLYARLTRHGGVPVSPRALDENLRRARGGWERLFVLAMVLLLVILLVSPLAALTIRSVSRLDAARGERTQVQAGLTLDYYRELFVNRRDSLFYVPPTAAVRNSLMYAGATVILALSMGFPAATLLAKPGRFNRWLDTALMLPLGTSAVTLGLGFILVFNRPPLDLRDFPLLVPLAHTLVALPFVVRNLQPALESIPENLHQAARVLGAEPWQVWLEVDLPIVARATLSSAIFAFTISLGEFGATSLLARPEFPTIPIAISRFLTQPGALNYGQALAMATLLMIVCSAGVLVIERMRLPGIGDF